MGEIRAGTESRDEIADSPGAESGGWCLLIGRIGKASFSPASVLGWGLGQLAVC